MKSEPSGEAKRAFERLSELCDGECDPHELRATVEAWRSEPGAQSRWHVYGLIGDVLRSEDLASAPSHDQAFLQALRGRLAEEPVVLAPRAPEPHTQQATPTESLAAVAVIGTARRPWAGAAAVAAGVVMVAGAVLVWRGAAAPEYAGAELAQQSASQPLGAASGATTTLAEAGGVLIQTNPALDRYLSAHRQFSQGPALAAPGGVRQVSLTPIEP